MRHLSFLLVLALVGCGGAPKKETKTPAAAAKPQTAKSYEKQSTGATFDPDAASVKPAPAPTKIAKDAPEAAPAPAPAAAPAAPREADASAETAQAEAFLRAGRYQDAVRQARLALGRNERYVPAMVVMAKAYYQLGRHAQATYVLHTRVLEPMEKGTLAVDPRDVAEIDNLLGLIALKKDLKTEALKRFREATEKDPNHAAAWNNLAALLVVQKDYANAVPAAERAVALQPNLAKARLNLGSAYRGTKQYEKSQVEYRKALALNPEYAEAYFNLGLLFMDAKEFPGMDTLQRLDTASKMLLEYKSRARAQGKLLKDDPVDEYLKRIGSDIRDEQKAIERRKRRAEEKARREQEKAKEAPKGDAAGAKTPAGDAAGTAAPEKTTK